MKFFVRLYTFFLRLFKSKKDSIKLCKRNTSRKQSERLSSQATPICLNYSVTVFYPICVGGRKGVGEAVLFPDSNGPLGTFIFPYGKLSLLLFLRPLLILSSSLAFIQFFFCCRFLNFITQIVNRNENFMEMVFVFPFPHCFFSFLSLFALFVTTSSSSSSLSVTFFYSYLLF